MPASRSAPPSTHDRTPLRARFLAELPDDPRVNALADAFEAGNYAAVRAHAPRLIQTAEEQAVRDAARALVERTRPDPLVRYLLALTALLFVAVALFAYGGGHG